VPRRRVRRGNRCIVVGGCGRRECLCFDTQKCFVVMLFSLYVLVWNIPLYSFSMYNGSASHSLGLAWLIGLLNRVMT